MRLLNTEATRFLLVGGINTVVGYVLYLVALQVLSYRLAYTAAFVVGVVLSYALNTYFVFQMPWSWRRLMAFPMVYALQYVVGLVALAFLVERMGVPVVFAPLLVVIMTIPVTFLASRIVIKGRPR